MSSEKSIVQEWSVEGLLDEIQQLHLNMPDRSLAFVLGAGASISSGIPAGGELARKWLQEAFHRLCLNKEMTLEEWAAKMLEVSNFRTTDAAIYYSKIFELRFSSDPKSGYAALEAEMKDAEPGLGYSILAKILDGPRHKVVVTTNFDNLVADALAIHALQHPLIVGHEALAGFVRPQMPRPLVAKIHRDLHLNPINDQNGVSKLGQGWTEALKGLFLHYTPLVIGYGGNDGSLMGFLNELPTGHIPGRLFWCYRKEAKPSNAILEIIAKHNAVLVAIDGFDEFMMQLLEKLCPDFDVKDIATNIVELGEKRAQRYQKHLDELLESQAKNNSTADSSSTEKSKQLMSKVSQDEDKWWTWALRARVEKDLDKQEEIYRDGIQHLPKSPELCINYAIFLQNQRKDDDAEMMYKRALELAPNDTISIGNYALFLDERRKDYDAAEVMYKRALELDPNHAINYSNFAIYLTKNHNHKDYNAAELMYKRALELDPNNANSTGNYANFLANQRKDYDAAEMMYKRALELAPNDTISIGKYALFLDQQRKDYDAAELMYKRALELDPNDVNNIANYTSLLLCKSDEASLEKFKRLVKSTIELSAGKASQALAEVLLYVFLYNERMEEQSEEILGRIKGLLFMDFERADWDFSRVFLSVFPKIHESRHDFYKALGDAILDASAIPALDKYPNWCNTPAIDPFLIN
jgi:Tfp pilus assembly protein PilF